MFSGVIAYDVDNILGEAYVGVVLEFQFKHFEKVVSAPLL